MASCQVGCDLTPNQETVVDHESTCGHNDFYQLPSVTVRDARSLSISSATSKTSDCNSSSSESCSPFSSPASSPNSSLSSSSSSDMMELAGRRGSHRSSPTNMSDKGRSEVHLELDSLESGVSQMRDKFEDLSSNNNNLYFSSPTKDKLRYNRRSLVRSSSSACSSISENMEDGCSSEESDADRNSSSSSSSSPRNKPPLQRSNAIRGDDNIQLSPRSISPINPVEELETYSGIKTVVRRPKKSQNGGSSPSWRWSVMGVGTGDYEAVTKASHKGRHLPPVSTSTPTGSNHGNGHAPVLRRSSIGLSSTSTALVSPRSKKLSTEFRRLSLQMDMPWRDPNERLVQFADWLIKRTEELLERSARARQKTYELLRLARNRQKDQIVY